MGNYAYLVMMDIPADMEEEFNRVYDTQHVPNIVKAPGVNGCVRYKVESTNNERMARYAALYDIDSPEIPTSDGWVSESEKGCLLYTSPSPRDLSTSRMPSSA